ncbi:MAG TPA: hypothetical protein VFE62_03265 [Gemmataceae bacterium]|nr:hypothetical protein [Gemmataceae bacterium]
MGIDVQRFLYRARTVDALVHDWTNSHDKATFEVDVEALASECIDLAKLCVAGWERVRELLRDDPNGREVEHAGNTMKSTVARTLQIVTSVQNLIATAVRQGITIKAASDLETSARQIREVGAGIDMMFPALDKKLADESLAAYNRGEYQTIEDLIDEAHCHRVRTD